MTEPRPSTASHAPWIAGAAFFALSLAGGALALSRGAVDPNVLLGSIHGTGAARATVSLGAVANGSNVGGDAVLSAARAGVDEALSSRADVALAGAAPASRGARVVGGRNAHVLDVNVVRVVRSPGRVLVEASVLVSSMPGRAYQFSTDSTVTLTGGVADSDEGLADTTRRAARAATDRAVAQMTAR